jgi:DNA adenine methylase
MMSDEQEKRISDSFQMPLLGLETRRIINVASVPQRSPFRYPGGKTWLVPYVRQWLTGYYKKPSEFIEPFAGGAIIGLTVAFDRLADHVTLVELDDSVAAVWKTIIKGDYKELANRILKFDLTPGNVDSVVASIASSTDEKAFQTIIKNRVNRGGILAPGAGRVKNGENGKGIKSRWYPETLYKRIMSIGKIRDRLTIIEGDGLDILESNATQTNTVFFIDPPYTAAGKKAGTRLYKFFNINHQRLFSISERLIGNFLMTYDDTPGVKDLAKGHGFKTALVPMKNTHHNQLFELLISCDLGWLERNL